ncbi:MAG: O-antigen ligase family protein [Hespellia sp.]|nr:O-antigen ligase family protein [Hespellia sp.]
MWFSFFIFIVSIAYILLYATKGADMHLYHGVVTKYLTFNLENPNKAGLFLLFIAISNTIQFYQRKKIVLKSIFLLFAVCFFYFIYETHSRNALIVILGFMVAFILVFRRKRTVRISKATNFFITIFPFVFTILYLFLIKSASVTRFFSFLIEDGKDLNSRVHVWENAYNVLKDHFVFGGYTQLCGDSSIFQLHNSHLDILGAFGIVPFVLFIKYLHSILNTLSSRQRIGGYKLVYYYAFIATIILGVFEAAVYNGGNGIGILTAVFILFSTSEDDGRSAPYTTK